MLGPSVRGGGVARNRESSHSECGPVSRASAAFLTELRGSMCPSRCGRAMAKECRTRPYPHLAIQPIFHQREHRIESQVHRIQGKQLQLGPLRFGEHALQTVRIVARRSYDADVLKIEAILLVEVRSETAKDFNVVLGRPGVTDRKSMSDVPRPIPYCWVTTKPPRQRSATPLSCASKSCKKERHGSGGTACASPVESTGIGQLPLCSAPRFGRQYSQ